MKRMFRIAALFLLSAGIVLPLTGCHHRHHRRRPLPPPAPRPVVVRPAPRPAVRPAPRPAAQSARAVPVSRTPGQAPMNRR